MAPDDDPFAAVLAWSKGDALRRESVVCWQFGVDRGMGSAEKSHGENIAGSRSFEFLFGADVGDRQSLKQRRRLASGVVGAKRPSDVERVCALTLDSVGVVRVHLPQQAPKRFDSRRVSRSGECDRAFDDRRSSRRERPPSTTSLLVQRAR
jgi:hypothetical protein